MFKNTTKDFKPYIDNEVVNLSVDTLQQETVTDLLKSIKLHGLCSMKKIPNSSSIPNASLQSQSINNCICVNYVNLQNTSQYERTLALKTAVFEEYYGIYGIALERQWPFQRFTDRVLRQIEMNERLLNCVVFILAPPYARLANL